jgi:hypothetical protein
VVVGLLLTPCPPPFLPSPPPPPHSQESYRGKAEGSPAIPYGSIVTLDVDSGKIETYATGIRNTVGFDWHPTRRGFRGQPLMFFTGKT